MQAEKTLHQQNPAVLNWRCRLTQVDLYSSRKTVVVLLSPRQLSAAVNCKTVLNIAVIVYYSLYYTIV